MEHAWCSRKGKFRNYFQNRKVGFNRKPRMDCHMQWEMAASCMSSTFLEQYQQICLWCCCSSTLGERPTPKYFPFWTVQLWKIFPLEPLEQIFNCFTNPGQGKYAWTGLDETEVAYINNFAGQKS